MVKYSWLLSSSHFDSETAEKSCFPFYTQRSPFLVGTGSYISVLGRFVDYPFTKEENKGTCIFFSTLLLLIFIVCWSTVMYHPCSSVGENRIISTRCRAAETGVLRSSLFQPATMDSCWHFNTLKFLIGTGADFHKYFHTWDPVPTCVRHIQHLWQSTNPTHMHLCRFSIDLCLELSYQRLFSGTQVPGFA